MLSIWWPTNWSYPREPAFMMCSMRGVLKKFIGNPQAAPPAIPPLHYGAVKNSGSHCSMRLARGVQQFLVQWADHPTSAATWEHIDDFER